MQDKIYQLNKKLEGIRNGMKKMEEKFERLWILDHYEISKQKEYITLNDLSKFDYEDFHRYVFSNSDIYKKKFAEINDKNLLIKLIRLNIKESCGEYIPNDDYNFLVYTKIYNNYMAHK